MKLRNYGIRERVTKLLDADGPKRPGKIAELPAGLHAVVACLIKGEATNREIVTFLKAGWGPLMEQLSKERWHGRGLTPMKGVK